MTRDSGSCVDVGKDVKSCGEFGGEGVGGMALEGEVLSGVVRGSAVVVRVVEVLSNAYNTTKTATTNDNDDDDINDDNDSTTSHVHAGHVDLQKSSPLEAATNQEAGVTPSGASVPAPEPETMVIPV